MLSAMNERKRTMAKPIPCTLHVNNRWGYCYTPTKHPSIADAVRTGRNYEGGFWFRVVANGKVVRVGHCDR